MLKPDSTRYPSVLPPHNSGPEWIEPDSVETGSAETAIEFSDDLGFRGREDLPSDLALDLKLHEILQQARLATAASGAMVALARGDRMVCRATLGDMAPSVGVYLNTRSGLSGACVQTREMQLCDDTLADPRVNGVACRDLGMRSIAALPVLNGEELWGVLEVFSSVPRAFSDFDLQSLQSLARKISHTVHEAIDGGFAAPEEFSQPLATDSAQIEAAEHQTLSDPDRPEPAPEPAPEPVIVRKDYRAGALTAAVLALAVLLGWMVGRVGWTLAVNRAPTQVPITPEEAQATLQITPDNQAVAPRHEEPTAPAKPVGSTLRSNSAAPSSKPKTETAEPTGGLVVYEHGKVVFRMAPSGTASQSKVEAEPDNPELPKSGVVGPGAIQKAATRENDPSTSIASTTTATTTTAPVSPTGSYVLQRVDPEYPEAARQQRIQGPVVLNALVGADGTVRELSVISGDSQLVKAATDAVRQWRFQPHQVKGEATEFETRITVNFALPQ